MALFDMLFICTSVFQAAIVGRTLRILLRVLQHLLHHGAKSSGRYALLMHGIHFY